MTTKLKSILLDDGVFMSLVLILIAIASFGLGRESFRAGSTIDIKNETAVQVLPPIERVGIIEQGASVNLVRNPDSEGRPVSQIEVVASRSGTKYHLPTCGGAKQIKETNLIRFDSVEMARAAGYTPAANCKGLK